MFSAALQSGFMKKYLMTFKIIPPSYFSRLLALHSDFLLHNWPIMLCLFALPRLKSCSLFVCRIRIRDFVQSAAMKQTLERSNVYSVFIQWCADYISGLLLWFPLMQAQNVRANWQFGAPFSFFGYTQAFSVWAAAFPLHRLLLWHQFHGWFPWLAQAWCFHFY